MVKKALLSVSEVRESTVGFRRFVQVYFFANGASLPTVCFQDFLGQFFCHTFAFSPTCGFEHPLYR
eukprot:m.149517 g.149517  ORF g.149517 m.149517 type:complete len:66 (+) comp24432_c0_seq4:65-262(+)